MSEIESPDTVQTLPRSGNAPLRFEGKLVAESQGERLFGCPHDRYHDLALYEHDQGGYVLHIHYQSNFRGPGGKGEPSEDRVMTCLSLQDVANRLTAYDPCAVVQGYPVGEQWRERQTRLLKEVKHNYRYQVSEILASFPLDLARIEPEVPMIDGNALARLERAGKFHLKEIQQLAERMGMVLSVGLRFKE